MVKIRPEGVKEVRTRLTRGPFRLKFTVMRVIKEFRDPRMKISIFSFNEKWIVKAEAGLCEQTYKFPQEEWSLERVAAHCEDEGFKTKIAARFETMHADMNLD